MTIKDFVLNQKPQSITNWEMLIEENGFAVHREVILNCAEYYNLITINHEAQFTSSINY